MIFCNLWVAKWCIFQGKVNYNKEISKQQLMYCDVFFIYKFNYNFDLQATLNESNDSFHHSSGICKFNK
jgi:hypothetical protein